MSHHTVRGVDRESSGCSRLQPQAQKDLLHNARAWPLRKLGTASFRKIARSPKSLRSGVFMLRPGRKLVPLAWRDQTDLAVGLLAQRKSEFSGIPGIPPNAEVTTTYRKSLVLQNAYGTSLPPRTRKLQTPRRQRRRRPPPMGRPIDPPPLWLASHCNRTRTTARGGGSARACGLSSWRHRDRLCCASACRRMCTMVAGGRLDSCAPSPVPRRGGAAGPALLAAPAPLAAPALLAAPACACARMCARARRAHTGCRRPFGETPANNAREVLHCPATLGLASAHPLSPLSLSLLFVAMLLSALRLSSHLSYATACPCEYATTRRPS